MLLFSGYEVYDVHHLSLAFSMLTFANYTQALSAAEADENVSSFLGNLIINQSVRQYKKADDGARWKVKGSPNIPRGT